MNEHERNNLQETISHASVNDVYAALFVQPLVFDRQLQPVQHETVQQFRLGTDVLEFFSGDQPLRDPVECVLLRILLPVEIIEVHSFPPFPLGNKKDVYLCSLWEPNKRLV